MDDRFAILRRVNGEIAYLRDDGCCQYHKYVLGQSGVLAGETDHVFGRGTPKCPENESWRVRLTLCSPCHYNKHHGNNGLFSQDDELMALEKANKMPQMVGFDEEMVARQVLLRMGVSGKLYDEIMEEVIGKERV